MTSSDLKTRVWAAQLLAGLQAGVLAGFLMMAWLMLSNVRRSQSVWTAPNLLSTAILGRAGLQMTFGAATIAGLSLQVVVAGLHGVLFGALVPHSWRAVWVVPAGILFSLISYALLFGRALEGVAPQIAMRAPRVTWLGAVLLFGAGLGFYAHFVRDLLLGPKLPDQALRPKTISSIDTHSAHPS